MERRKKYILAGPVVYLVLKKFHGRKYIWGCVLCALLTAVLIGMIYYYNDVRGTDQVSEGTLIWQALPVKERTDTDVFGK